MGRHSAPGGDDDALTAEEIAQAQLQAESAPDEAAPTGAGRHNVEAPVEAGRAEVAPADCSSAVSVAVLTRPEPDTDTEPRFAEQPRLDHLAPNLTAPDHVAPDHVAPDYAAPDYATPDTPPDSTALDFAPPDYAAPDYAAPDYAAPDYAAPDYAAPVGATPNYPAVDYASPGYATPDYATPDYATPDYATPDYATPDYATPDYASPDYATPNIATRDVAAPARPETEPEAPPVTSSRAGRNLPAAIGVSLALGAVIIASLLLYRPSFVAIVCIAMAYGTFEMVRAIGAAEARPPLVPLVAGGIAMDVAAWYQGANALVLGLLLTVLGVTVWRLAEGAVGYARDVTSAAFIALYVPMLGGFAVLLTHYSDGAGRVLAFIATVVCSDVGGYTAGVLFGKHPMAPTVSPKKSWEGFVGSALACAIGGALFMSLLFHHRWWIGVLYGLAIAVTATLGDLGESMVKRDLGVKDMGRLLPGHGGLMDRLDSLLPCAAVAYLIMAAALT